MASSQGSVARSELQSPHPRYSDPHRASVTGEVAERMDVAPQRTELFRAAEIDQIHYEAGKFRDTTTRPDELERGSRRSPGRDQIVHEEHLRSRRKSVRVHLEAVRSVFERVVDTDDRRGEFPCFAYRDESDAEGTGHGTPEDEPARFDCGDYVDAAALTRRHHLVHSAAESFRITDQRGDIPKKDPLLRVVGNRSDVRGDRACRHDVLRVIRYRYATSDSLVASSIFECPSATNP